MEWWTPAVPVVRSPTWCSPLPASRPPGVTVGGPVRRRAGDAVEHDAEHHDGQAGRQTLAEDAELHETGHDVVAESARADETADDDHRQHVDEALVRGQHQR